jgi:hypothetical protein
LKGFAAERKLLKQFFVYVGAHTGLKPGVNGKCLVFPKHSESLLWLLGKDRIDGHATVPWLQPVP